VRRAAARCQRGPHGGFLDLALVGGDHVSGLLIVSAAPAALIGTLILGICRGRADCTGLQDTSHSLWVRLDEAQVAGATSQRQGCRCTGRDGFRLVEAGLLTSVWEYCCVLLMCLPMRF
jgi:hypothetical protein